MTILLLPHRVNPGSHSIVRCCSFTNSWQLLLSQHQLKQEIPQINTIYNFIHYASLLLITVTALKGHTFSFNWTFCFSTSRIWSWSSSIFSSISISRPFFAVIYWENKWNHNNIGSASANLLVDIHKQKQQTNLQHLFQSSSFCHLQVWVILLPFWNAKIIS